MIRTCCACRREPPYLSALTWRLMQRAPIAPRTDIRTSSWGIGLNYGDRAANLHEQHPEQPAPFIKGDHTVVGPGRADPPTPTGQLPHSRSGTRPHHGAAHPRSHRPGCLRPHLRRLSCSRSYSRRHPQGQSSLSDSIEELPDDLTFDREITTVEGFLTGRRLDAVDVTPGLAGQRPVAISSTNMTHRRALLVRLHNEKMPLYPCDLICTGTPGARVLSPGVVAKARVQGLPTLTNPVVGQEERQ